MTRSPAPLDDTSKAIIEQLQQDGRRPYAAIGKVVGLSEAAVRQRVQRLIDSGIMQVVAVTDPMQLGFARQAMIGVKVSGDARTVADALIDMPGVSYVVLTAGSFDLLVEHCTDNPEFQVRFRWEVGSIAVWDNRCVQHYAVPDYSSPRVMQRVVTEGQRPVGPA